MKTRHATWAITLAFAVLISTSTPEAQTVEKVWRVGFVAPMSQAAGLSLLESFRQGLRDRGYVEGRSVSIEDRWADGDLARLPGLVADLVGLRVDVIVAVSVYGARAARSGAGAIPVVFTLVPDPVMAGLVSSLARPSGGLTGIAAGLGAETSPKWVDLVRETLPAVTRVAILSNPSNPVSAASLAAMSAAGHAQGLSLRVFDARDADQLAQALVAISSERPGALIVAPDILFRTQQSRILEFAAAQRLPTVFYAREFAEAGGFLSYGPSGPAMFRQAATFVDRILKGVQPGDLPIEQPEKFELVVNRKTANAIGIKIPPPLLQRADQIIE